MTRTSYPLPAHELYTPPIVQRPEKIILLSTCEISSFPSINVLKEGRCRLLSLPRSPEINVPKNSPPLR